MIKVIYHGGCMDGTCAAWLAWRQYGDAAEYIEAWYGKPPPDCTGDDVVILDFSYPLDAMLQIIGQARSLLLLDHHKTAKADLDQLQDMQHSIPVELVFDMQQSGAGLALRRFHPHRGNWLAEYVEDRDLWRFALPESEDVNAFVQCLDPTIEAYERAFTNHSPETAAQEGRGANAYKRAYVRKMVEQARRFDLFGFEAIPVVNAPYVGTSELVGELAESAPFALGWYQRADGKIACSLRSRGDNGVDVSDLAQRFGGGGHRNAAGFQVPSLTALQTMFELGKAEP